MLGPAHGSTGPRREVHCTDALPWLRARGVAAGASFITSLPDVSELAPMTLPQWRAWFIDAAALVARACPDDGLAIFYQSDVIVDGAWIDKAHLVTLGVEAAGQKLLGHRVVCRTPPGASQYGRPAYAHLLAFSKTIKARKHLARVDVLPDTGAMTWSKAMGVAACVEACRLVQSHCESRVIVDPFCGHGTVLAVANALGLDAVGVERARRRAQTARNLQITLGESGPV